MSALAVAQPLLDILGSEPTFFVAHGADGWAVTRFALAVILVPAAVVLAALFAARAVAQRSWRILVPATYGALAAATIVPAIDRSLHLRLRAFLPLTAVVAVGVGWAMWRWEIARSYARATVIGALVFPLLFLVSSPTSGLVFPDTASGATSVSQAKNVMVVVFDELPLGALLDRDGTIDEVRFPGFARLADESTWYRNTTTVAPWTEIAVPALLTGRQPPSEMVVPAEANHPHNLFRMLAGTHDLHAQEPLTQMCPRDRCDMVTEPPNASLYRDSATVYLHGLLPDSLAERWLPPIGDQWADFGGAPGGPTPAPGREEWANSFFEQQDDDQVAIFEGFLDTVDQETSRVPQLWFDHLLVPHSPLIYLPTGEIYDEFTRPPGHAEDSWLEWGGDELLIEQARQRFVLQVKYVDQLVDQLLDTLERTGHDDDTLLVVASDHGIVFGPGAQRRGLTDHTADELLPVPLFVRYPGEPGRIDDEPRQIIDVLPTIVDVLGVDLPPDWQFDGRSLREPEGDAERAVTYPDVVRFTEGVDLTAAAAPYLAEFGTGRSKHDVYAWGPHADLVGSPAAPPRTGGTAGRPEVRIVTEGLQDVDPDSGFVPALVRLDLDAASVPDRWVAVAVNGTIAGLGLTWADPAQHTATVVIDPALLRAGTNRVEVFLVGPDGTLQPTTLVD